MKALLLFLLLALPLWAPAYTYTVGQNLRWDESRVLTAGQSVLIPPGVLAYCDFQVTGPGVTIRNEGNWNPSQTELLQGAVLTNVGRLNALFLRVTSGVFVNQGQASLLYLPVGPAGTVQNTGAILCVNTFTLAGTLQNCGTLTAKTYTVAPGSTTTPCKPLPVQLLTFTAELALGAVRLTWTTAQEVNTARYEVERSGDGQFFGLLSQQPAKGPGAYVAADKTRVGPQYYRLRIVDADDVFSYSPVAFLSGPQLVSRAWYNEAGQRLSTPRPGFLIEVSTYNNGAVESRKYLQE
ncbi:MAG: hypothetical protein ACRYFR_04985 [Janthinobacterium lividum]